MSRVGVRTLYKYYQCKPARTYHMIEYANLIFTKLSNTEYRIGYKATIEWVIQFNQHRITYSRAIINKQKFALFRYHDQIATFLIKMDFLAIHSLISHKANRLWMIK